MHCAKLPSISNYWRSFQIDPIKGRLLNSCLKTFSKVQKKLSNKHLLNSEYKPHLYC